VFEFTVFDENIPDFSFLLETLQERNSGNRIGKNKKKGSEEEKEKPKR